jgi:UDP-N-acetylmuramate--alanine ligase
MLDFSKISAPGGSASGGKKIYLIGIKGTGMVALAEILSRSGYKISGSDTKEKFFTDEILKRLYIRYHEGFASEHITDDIDFVVYSTAYSDKNNEEIKAAKYKSIPMLAYPEMLGELFNRKYGIAVCGTHGKTTTTAMLGEIFRSAELEPSVVVGSMVKDRKSVV